MPACGDGLEEPDEHPSALLAEVAVAVEVFDDRQVAMDALHRLGKQVVVLGSLQRHIDTGHARELPCP